jgi:SAM-dependent methyltransferase
MDGETRWTDLRGAARAAAYDARWERLTAAGDGVHGEADLVDALLGRAPEGVRPARVLDAGCGTGRVAIELARRGHDTVGVDRDPDLLAAARAKAPSLAWVEADLAELGAAVPASSVELAVLAGNVLLFCDEGTEKAVVAEVAASLRPGGLLVAGFQLRAGGYDVEAHDEAAAGAGLTLRARWATWERDPWAPGDDYQVSVHRRGLLPPL